MKSYWIRAMGGATVLEVRDVPVPEPAADQMLVRVRAAGLNRGEFLSRADLHGAAGPARPAGTEGAGEVVSVGPGVSGFKPGDRVMATTRGTFAEYVLMPAAVASAVPANLSWIEAATTPLIFLVVHDVLVAQGHIKPGEWVFIAGASSGVGTGTIAAAKALGARTIGTSGSTEKLARLREAGLDVGIQTRGPAFYDAIMEATGGKGADIIVNAVGGTVFDECVRSLAYVGRLAIIGYVDGVLNSAIDLGRVHGERLSIYGVSATKRSPEMRDAAVRAFNQDFVPLLASGAMKPLIDRVFPFAELPQAKAYMESDAHVGKIAIEL